nr:YlaN family protein [Exiguobacterium qingdaonense]
MTNSLSSYGGGVVVATNLAAIQREQALQLLESDAEKIRCLIEVQLENLKMPKCPLYEEVLDTHMFGLSRQIDFAVRLGLISDIEGKGLLDSLEQKLSALAEASEL